MTSCPICLRPRSKYEITRAYAQMREDATRRRRRPFLVAGWLLAAGGAGYALWFFREPLGTAVAAARARAARFADDSMDARKLAGRPSAAAPASEPAAAPASFDPEKPLSAPVTSSSVAVAAAAPAPVPAQGAVMPARRPVGPVRLEDLHVPVINPANQWIMYGRAYDLVSLKPATGVQLMFQSGESGVTATASTDDEGRYAAVLPRLQEGSLAALSADPRFVPTILCEPDIPYGTLSADERRSLVRGAQDGDARPAVLSDPAGEESLRRDLYLAPRR